MPFGRVRLLDTILGSSSALAILGLGTIGTVAATTLAARNARSIDERRFDEEITAITGAIKQRMEVYVNSLYGARAFVVTSERVDRERFRAWADASNVFGRYPGIQGIGWAAWVPSPERRGAHVAKMVVEGARDFRVWPEGDRDGYGVISYLEPSDFRNARAIGFDMLSEPTRREAMMRSRAEARPIMSGRVTLVQETESAAQAGFLVYLATTDAGGDLLGWAYAPFRAADLLERTVRTVAASGVSFSVHDGPPGEHSLLYATPGADAVGRLSRVVPVEIGGRTWSLRFATTAEFERDSRRRLPLGVAAASGLLTILAAVITAQQARRRAVAEAFAHRAALLATVGRELSSSLELPRALENVGAAILARYAAGCSIEANGRTLLAAGIDRSDGALAAEFPLVARGETFGHVRFSRNEGERPFDDAERAIALEIARLVASGIENARAYEETRAAVALRDDFLSIASHELRTPLTSLLLQLVAIRRRIARGDAASATHDFERVERQIQRIARLVDDLLDISRIAHGQLRLEPERFDLGDLATEVVARLAEQATAAGSTVAIVREGPALGSWDRLRIEQVVTNLISNAIKYGQGRPIEVRVSSSETSAELAVVDRGIGIAIEDAERIFGRFERAVSSRNFGGLGLGLYITRQIVEAHGGTIAVTSRPGEGATFAVSLPIRP
jgi:signal transduction histidine kinase